MTEGISRRDLLKVVGAAGAVTVMPAEAGAQAVAPEATAAVSPAASDVLFFFNEEEARFVEAAIERLIPAEPEWTGAAGAGVLYYIDRQLGAAYGAGARMYLRGPWSTEGTPQQGYQLRYSPAEVYRIGIEEVRAHVRSANGESEFWDLAPAAMDALLTELETGEVSLPSLPSAVFFETLLANTIEGYFADPAHGGNRDMVGWRMVGFPGAYAAYLDTVDQHGLHYEREPIGMADHAARLRHIHSGH